MDVLHAAMWVEDVESAEAFYTEGLGLHRTREFESDDGATNRFVGGKSDTEIQFKYYADGEDPDGDGNAGGDQSSGFDHVAVAVDDIEESIATLTEEFDSELLKGPKHLEDKDIRIAFVTDPEGYTVELIEQIE
ncbi:VOC family protein [Halorubrum sp. F4]|uniref:VOC family protein n=1 Tax=Halorubrum sp. F4 TaxID=2989715 RepID=UPI002480482E|nr:VOC family protein [Halorubrum sp. F4]